MTTTRKFIPELEGWRGSAVTFLLLGHFGPDVLFPMGRLGVEFFFVLSGRLMAQLLFIDQMDLRDFYVRRISRVFPALWVFAIVAFVTTTLLGKLHVSIFDFLAATTFTINYSIPYSALSHIWSLCVEEHSYVLLSLVAIANRRQKIDPVPVLAAIAAACILNGALQTWWLDRNYYQVYWHTDVRAASILIPAIVFLSRHRLRIPPIMSAAAVICGIALNLLSIVPDPVKYSLGTALLAIGVVDADQLPFLRNKFLSVAGLWSFSIYLWQQPFALKDSYRALYLPGAVIIGIASFYLLEQPARAYINRRFSRRAASEMSQEERTGTATTAH